MISTLSLVAARRAARVALVVSVLLPSSVVAQVTYTRAERLLSWNTSPLISGDSVRPQWLLDGNRFWYRNKTAAGAEYVLVDPVRNTRAELFDNARLAAALSMANDTSYDANHLPFRSFKFTDDGKNEHEIEFSSGKRRFVCDISAYRCTVHDTLPSDVPFVLSPDKKSEAFVSKYNVYVRPHAACTSASGQRGAMSGCDSTQLTTDGVKYWSYGLGEPRPSELQRPQPRRPQIRWSPDSKKLAVYRTDERNVAQMPYISYTPQRPKLYTQPYALPGDTIVPLPSLHIINVATKANIAVNVQPRPSQLTITGSARDSAWSAGSDRVYVTWITRASKSAYLASVDANTGAYRIIARDSTKTFVEIGPPSGDPVSWYVTKDNQDAFWWSERDGWAHLYRVDASGATQVVQAGGPAGSAGDATAALFRGGSVKNQLTVGPWYVGAIQYVDEGTK
ncbi:MAG TPA: DPP IV N-terminal domain-containing protein, partial [Gemmatimonadaceae bacterium]